MAQICEICGKGSHVGRRVSHAHNVTSRRWKVNLQRIRVMVGRTPRRMRVCASCIRAGRVTKA
jgi:large subunit ribosomal protein L28